MFICFFTQDFLFLSFFLYREENELMENISQGNLVDIDSEKTIPENDTEWLERELADPNFQEVLTILYEGECYGEGQEQEEDEEGNSDDDHDNEQQGGGGQDDSLEHNDFTNS